MLWLGLHGADWRKSRKKQKLRDTPRRGPIDRRERKRGMKPVNWENMAAIMAVI